MGRQELSGPPAKYRNIIEYAKAALQIPTSFVRTLRNSHCLSQPSPNTPYPVRYGRNLYDDVYTKVAQEQGGIVVTNEYRPIYARVTKIVAVFPIANAVTRQELTEELSSLLKKMMSDASASCSPDVGDIYKAKPGLLEARYMIRRALIFPPIEFERFRRMVELHKLRDTDGSILPSDRISSTLDVFDSLRLGLERGQYTYQDLFTTSKEFKSVERSLHELYQQQSEEVQTKDPKETGPNAGTFLLD